MERRDLLIGLFITCLVLANVMGSKITSLFGLRASVSIFIMPLLFVISDIITEVEGKKAAQDMVNTALIILVFVFLYTALAIHLPPNPAYTGQDAYALIFGQSLRITAASIIAFALAQLMDIAVFSRLKAKTGSRQLWLRSNLSTYAGQLVDTLVFMFLAFYMMTPTYTAGFVLSIAWPYYLLKVLFAVIDTPFVYLGVAWLRAEKKDR